MKHSGLAARVKRLERAARSRRPRRLVVYAIGGEHIDGMAGNGMAVERRWGEAVGALASRCAALTGAKVLLGKYRAPAPLPADFPSDLPPGPVPVPTFDTRNRESWRDWRQFVEQGLQP